MFFPLLFPDPCLFRLNLHHNCYPDYTYAAESHSSYTPEAIRNDTYGEFYETTGAWDFLPSTQLRGEPLWAIVGFYGGGGYVAKLDVNRDISEKIIQELKDNMWLDRKSRAVLIEFTTFNPNVNLFAYVTLTAEFPPTGGVVTFSSVQVVQGYALGVFTVVVYISGVVTLLFTLYYAISEAIRCYKTGRKEYFKPIVSWVNLAMVVDVIFTVTMFSLRMAETTSVLQTMKQDLNAYVPFRRVVEYDQLYRAGIAFLNLFCFWKFVLLMKIYKRIENFLKALGDSMPPLMSFAVCYLFLLFSFSLLGYLLFMTGVYDYRSITSSIASMFCSSLGVFDIETLMTQDQTGFAQIFFSVYMVIMNMIMLNIMVAIILDSQSALEVDPNEPADLDVLLSRLWTENKNKEKENDDKADEIQKGGGFGVDKEDLVEEISIN